MSAFPRVQRSTMRRTIGWLARRARPGHGDSALRRFGLATRLTLTGLSVLLMAVTASFYLASRHLERTLDAESEALARTAVDAMVSLVRRHGLEEDHAAMRAAILDSTARLRRAP